MLSITALAQPNFSGNWALAKSKSTLNDQFSMAPEKIEITQDGNSMKVAKHVNFQGNSMTIETSYTLDGKECTNEGFQGTKTKSTVKVADDKLSLTISTIFPMQDGEMKITETYKMSGADLSVNSQSDSSWGTMNETWILEKK